MMKVEMNENIQIENVKILTKIKLQKCGIHLPFNWQMALLANINSRHVEDFMVLLQAL
jgi:hypothetical protein